MPGKLCVAGMQDCQDSSSMAAWKPCFLYSFVRHRQGCHGNVRPTMADIDLEAMSREQLIAEVMKLRDGIRKHRDSSGHELCWHHPALWALLP
jgi:hypothetical protein